LTKARLTTLVLVTVRWILLANAGAVNFVLMFHALLAPPRRVTRGVEPVA